MAEPDAVVPDSSPLTTAPLPEGTARVAPVATPVAASAPARLRGPAPLSRDANSDEEDDSPPVAGAASPWTIAFGVLSAVLAILAVVLWTKLEAREATIRQSENRMAQIQAGAASIQAQLDEAKAVGVRQQKQLGETKTEIFRLNTDLDKSKAEADDLQEQMAQQRAKSGNFQTQMEEAKVASLKRQGAVEVAQAQTTVAQTQFNQARADLVQAGVQLTEARAKATELQSRLDRATNELTQLQKQQVRK